MNKCLGCLNIGVYHTGIEILYVMAYTATMSICIKDMTMRIQGLSILNHDRPHMSLLTKYCSDIQTKATDKSTVRFWNHFEPSSSVIVRRVRQQVRFTGIQLQQFLISLRTIAEGQQQVSSKDNEHNELHKQSTMLHPTVHPQRKTRMVRFQRVRHFAARTVSSESAAKFQQTVLKR